MRIIAGEFRGRRLLPPAGDVTRPITDRVKQSLFDILAPLLEGAVVYDLFAGTGSMGLESLSRGASHAVFFESNRSAWRRLQQNVETLGLQHRSRVIPADLFQWFFTHEERPAGDNTPAEVIFLDPPYRFLNERPEDLQNLARVLAGRHLAPSGTLVFRHDAADTLELPALRQYDERIYGGMALKFFSRHLPT